MIDAGLDLQQSIFKTLNQDSQLLAVLGSHKIFDRVPERVRFPYLVIGRSVISDWSTSTESGEAITVFIHTWSKLPSRSESHEIQAHIKRIMSDGLLPLADHHLVNLRFQLAETRRDRLSGHFHGVLRFRAITEPKV